jgi:glycosyltransferase involved in cell wall biosynthesis
MQLVLSLSPGGTERLVIEICKRLQASVEFTVCCLDKAGEWAAELTDGGTPVVALNRLPGFRPSLGYRIARLATRDNVDVIHCHQYSPFVYGAIATLLKARVGLIYTEHGRLAGAGRSPKRRLANPLLARLPGEIFAVSADLKRHMMADGLPGKRIAVCLNGIEPGPVPGEAERVSGRRALSVPDDVHLIGTVGRLDPVKNLQALLKAHAALPVQARAPHLAIVGTGPEQRDLEALARALGTVHLVHFAGYRSDVRALMPAFDVYVNCSTFEGVSLTILEAMAARVPVVATRVGGTPEVVVDGETGMLVPVEEVAPLAQALFALERDPARRRAMGIASRSRVLEYFTIERMTKDYEHAYQRHARRARVAA